ADLGATSRTLLLRHSRFVLAPDGIVHPASTRALARSSRACGSSSARSAFACTWRPENLSTSTRSSLLSTTRRAPCHVRPDRRAGFALSHECLGELNQRLGLIAE